MASKEIILSISDVEEVIAAFEKKYKISSSEFLLDQKLREALPEDEVFEWEAFIDHRNELLEMNQEMHREYLQQVTPAPDHLVGPKDTLALAA